MQWCDWIGYQVRCDKYIGSLNSFLNPIRIMVMFYPSRIGLTNLVPTIQFVHRPSDIERLMCLSLSLYGSYIVLYLEY